MARELSLRLEEKQFIKKVCDHLLSTIDNLNIKHIGFDLAKILNIRIIGYSFLSSNKQLIALDLSNEGFVIIDGEMEYVLYNDIILDSFKQNMVIIKNIGHIILDHTNYGNVEEEEANFFLEYIMNNIMR